MCETVVVRLKNREPQWCDTGGELAKALNCRPAQLPVEEYMRGWRQGWNNCLCHVDFPALAKQRGLSCRAPDWINGSGAWELYAPQKPEEE